MLGEVALIRHAETEWSREGRHTGPHRRAADRARPRGGGAAARAARRLALRASCSTSPLARARETCELAGLGAQAEVHDDLLEWDYGEYEGLTSAEIERLRPGWGLWRDGCPGGEQRERRGRTRGPRDRAARRRRGARARSSRTATSCACWARAGPRSRRRHGARLGLFTAAICVLGHEHGLPIIVRWNDTSGSHEARTAAATED